MGGKGWMVGSFDLAILLHLGSPLLFGEWDAVLSLPRGLGTTNLVNFPGYFQVALRGRNRVDISLGRPFWPSRNLVGRPATKELARKGGESLGRGDHKGKTIPYGV